MKLIFKLKGNQEKWPARLEGYLGKELAQQTKVEVDATASQYLASIQLLQYKSNSSLESKLKNDNDVISAFLISDKAVQTKLV